MTAVRDVSAQDWRREIAGLRSDGFTLLCFVTAIDRGDRLEILAAVAQPSPYAVALVRTAVDDLRVDSVADLWPAALWHEREAAEMFGIDFMGGAASQVLLLVSPSPAHPLRKSVPLTARVTRPWPGAEEAHEDSRRRSASRR